MATTLDGNVLAGALAEFLVPDATTLRARCMNCSRVAMLAQAVVYPDAAGLVARCASCDHVLATIVDAGDRLFLGLSGISAIALQREAPQS